jgi:hypothetical protein
MQWRDFIAAGGGVVIAGPPVALAQRSDRMWRVAVVMNSAATNTESQSYLDSMESDGRSGRLHWRAERCVHAPDVGRRLGPTLNSSDEC